MCFSKSSTHGGNIYEVSREFVVKEKDIVDFSANINPLGLSPLAKKNVVERLSLQRNYPDPDYLELRRAISGYLNVPLNDIIVGNGATELIYLFFRSLKPSSVLIPIPTFSEYERAARLAGCKTRHFLLEERDDFRLSSNKLIRNLEGVEAVVLCNPNNPTGTVLPKQEIKEIAHFCKERNILMLIDEAFVEFVDDESYAAAVGLLGEFKNMIVIRAFTKFFGIPGMRLGYGITKSVKIKEAIQSFKEPWSVNGLAAAAGIAALGDEEYIKKSKSIISVERKYLLEELSKFSWLKPFSTCANFILVKILDKEISSSALRQKLIPFGVLIRDASNFLGLNNSFFRVAVRDREDNDKLILALKKCRGA
ncbi:threonine-phosphate decarboxylase CobD [Thermovirga sp.]|uniref:threonine-phosphate decarboxylase CobD n=1 Tax=Thermovirga sp. TaxID=2699834 RepID=UPI0025FCF838|nr:threonine-phosphate decarboxylase CobD [Thermovirga sp.]MBO8154754.1 threonine-phosphate decarboxylase [Thermovirga sp.]